MRFPLGRDPGGAGDADVVRDDEGDGDRCRGLALRSCSISESLSEGCSCRSFWLSLIVALSRFREVYDLSDHQPVIPDF